MTDSPAVDEALYARTLESLEAAGDLARTIESRPRDTIVPDTAAGGEPALEALRRIGGTLDGRIHIHETIGEGGMGVVHLATQETLGRNMASFIEPGLRRQR